MGKKASIIQKDLSRCYVCGSPYVEIHHVFNASNRPLSEKYHLTVALCHSHHNEPPDGVHFNKAFRTKLQIEAQEAFEQNYPDLNFREIFGRNFKED